MTEVIWKLGPAHKRRGTRTKIAGAILHSAEGSWNGLWYELNRADRGAAWHYSILKNGTIYGHYNPTIILWHAGDWGGDQDGADGNGELIGIEFEGKAGEPFTEAQYLSAGWLLRTLGRIYEFTPRRKSTGRTLWEHRELSDTGTDCPSGRIDWARMMEEFTEDSPEFDVYGKTDRDDWNRLVDAMLKINGSTHETLQQTDRYDQYLVKLRRGA